MPSVIADIENLKRELERAHSELLQMYQELGETSFAWHDAISYEPSQEPYDKLAPRCWEKTLQRGPWPSSETLRSCTPA